MVAWIKRLASITCLFCCCLPVLADQNLATTTISKLSEQQHTLSAIRAKIQTLEQMRQKKRHQESREDARLSPIKQAAELAWQHLQRAQFNEKTLANYQADFKHKEKRFIKEKTALLEIWQDLERLNIQIQQKQSKSTQIEATIRTLEKKIAEDQQQEITHHHSKIKPTTRKHYQKRSFKVISTKPQLLKNEAPTKTTIQINSATKTPHAQPPVSVDNLKTTPLSNLTPKRTRNPKATSWMKKSYQAVRQQNWIETIRTASVAIRLDPGLVEPYINRSIAYTENSFFQRALEDANVALKLQPKNLLAVNNRGLAYHRMGNIEKATIDYEFACHNGLDLGCSNYKDLTGESAQPKDQIPRLLTKSLHSFQLKDWNQVIRLTSKVIKLDKQNDTAFTNRGAAYANQGLLSKAMKDCTQAVIINPNNSLAYNNLGYIYQKMNKLDDATIQYEISCHLGNALGCRNTHAINSLK